MYLCIVETLPCTAPESGSKQKVKTTILACSILNFQTKIKVWWKQTLKYLTSEVKEWNRIL